MPCQPRLEANGAVRSPAPVPTRAAPAREGSPGRLKRRAATARNDPNRELDLSRKLARTITLTRRSTPHTS
jgi:hypothetical protein